MKSKPFSIGRKDKVDLPDLDLWDIPAKIDTGARTSSLHCDAVELREVDGKEVLFFQLHPIHKDDVPSSYTFEEFDTRRVKSSTGVSQTRFVIKTKITIFKHTFTTEFTLANRKKMNYPILLGRRLLKKNFIVDVRKANLSYQDKYDAS